MAKKTSQNSKAPASFRGVSDNPWLFSARIDPWLTHRISMTVMVLGLAWTMVWGADLSTDLKSFAVIAILQALINWPHFMVSYKVLYIDHRDLKKHSMAMLYVPLVLFLAWFIAVYWVVVGEVVTANNYAYLIWVIAAFYLAWHYVGQTWGLVSLGILQSGVSIHVSELKIFRGCLKVMIGWHVVWAVQQLGHVPILTELKSSAAMGVANGLALASWLVCLAVFGRIYKRLGQLPEKVWAPLMLLYLWYLTLWSQPVFALFIQLSHALQYLIFPAKIQVAMHFEKAQSDRAPVSGMSGPWGKLAFTYLSCVVFGCLVFLAPVLWGKDHQSMMILAGLLGSLVNIHHYFTDGAIWKLRDSRVRALLLSPMPSYQPVSAAKGSRA